MTTYSTGNPVGSPDPRDLYDNAENLDQAVNSEADTWEDRLGVERYTLAWIDETAREAIAQAGYVGTGTDNAVEDYTAGIEITQYNQIVRDTTGEFWRVSGSETLPYTLTGAGVPESGTLVSVGDAALRQDLVQPVATFDSVSAMKASTVLGIGRKARTLGYYTPGDGGGNDYEIVAAAAGTADGGSFIDLAGSGLQAKGLFGYSVKVRQFGYPITASSLEAAMAYSVSSGLSLSTEDSGDVAEIGNFDIPNGATFTESSKLTIKYVLDPAFSGSPFTSTAINIGENVTLGSLVIETQGGLDGEAFNLCTVGSNFTAQSFRVEDQSRSLPNTAVAFIGSSYKISRITSKNFARPFQFRGDNSLTASDIEIGYLEVDTYIRALSLDKCRNINIDHFRAFGRDVNASKSPGHNGILSSSVVGLNIRVAQIEDTGEHGIRLGGHTSYTGPYESDDIKIGSYFAARTGGCQFKIAGNVGQFCSNVDIGQMIGHDIGEGAGGGNNQQIRITRGRAIHIGSVVSLYVDRMTYVQPISQILVVAESTGVTVDSIVFDGCLSPAIGFPEQDASQDDSSDVYIGSITCTEPDFASVLVAFYETTFSGIKDIFIHNAAGYFDRGGADGIVVFNTASVNVTGPIHVGGSPRIPVMGHALQNAPNRDDCTIDFRIDSGATYSGPMFSSAQGGRAIFTGLSFLPTDAGAFNSVVLLNANSTSGNGEYGGAVEINRPGSSRRGAAIAAKQATTNANEIDLDFFMGAGAIVTNALRLGYSMRDDGDFEIHAPGKGARLKSPNGTVYRLTVDDTGAVTTTAV